MPDDPKPKRVPTKEQAEVAHEYLCDVVSDESMQALCNEVIREYLEADLRVGYCSAPGALVGPTWTTTQPYTISGYSQVLDNPRTTETQ